MITQLLFAMLLFFVSYDVSFAVPFDRFLMPGDLIDSHKKYENDCDKCHAAFAKDKQNALCLNCHKKIKSDVSEKKGYHGKSKLIQTRECKFCHTDHIGRGAKIVNLDKYAFDHALTDFKLKGAHKKLACNSCHIADKKYRQAKSACYDCHKDDDIHQKRLGEKCQNCHVNTLWKKAKFDHDKTKYKLKGKHKKVSCGDCHPNQRFRFTPVKCVECHRVQDVHQNEMGKQCQKCHTTKSWKKILFDHNKETKFKLQYRHNKISCGSCHVKNAYKFKLKKSCYSCHKSDDKHNTQFGVKCKKCHSQKKWSVVLFKHDKDTDYKLLGAHKKTACKSCHIGNVYKEKLKMTCGTCHKLDDVHAGNLGNQCQHCHNQNQWMENIVFDHDLTSFPLIGLHGITSCESCHSSEGYKTDAKTCYDCHEADDEHKLKLTTACANCHTPNAWNVWIFDHNSQTDYRLDGEHEKVECIACHTQAINNNKIVLSDKCESCHRDDDIHSGQFGSSCGRCHSTDAFKNIEKMNDQ